MTAKLNRVRAALRERRINRRARLDYKKEFNRGYRAGIAFALSLLPAADADLTMFDLGAVREELEDRC